MTTITRITPTGGPSTVQILLDSGESLRVDADSLIDYDRVNSIVLRATKRTLALPADRSWEAHIGELWKASVWRGEVI